MGKRTILAVVLALQASGCAWVRLDAEAEAVRVREVGDVAACERLGKTHTRTLDEVGFIPRREKSVAEELSRLARNEAVRMGGDTVAPLEEAVAGEQVFGIYDCP